MSTWPFQQSSCWSRPWKVDQDQCCRASQCCTRRSALIMLVARFAELLAEPCSAIDQRAQLAQLLGWSPDNSIH
jgi:hypothetical protein